MTGAVIRACSTGTTLSFISREALTLTSFTVTDATVGTLSILVVISELVGSIHPGELERADALRAITTVVS